MKHDEERIKSFSHKFLQIYRKPHTVYYSFRGQRQYHVYVHPKIAELIIKESPAQERWIKKDHPKVS